MSHENKDYKDFNFISSAAKKVRAAFVGALALLSGCTTTSVGGSCEQIGDGPRMCTTHQSETHIP